MSDENNKDTSEYLYNTGESKDTKPEEEVTTDRESNNMDDLSPTQGEDYVDSAMEHEEIDLTAATDPQNLRIIELENELDKSKENMLRALAEAENTRRRATKDIHDARKYAIASFARDLLDFSDNFRRALSAIPDDLKDVDERISNVLTGIEAMEKDLLKTFDKNGIEKIEPLGEIFDPNYHEVMFEAPGSGQPAGAIIELIEPGYVIGERLLRPARVGVAKDEGQGSGTPEEPGSKIDQEV